MARIEVAALEGMAVLRGDAGVWLRDCFSVTLDGFGYAADHLDIELRKVGEAARPDARSASGRRVGGWRD